MTHRRTFLTTAIAGIGYWSAPLRSRAEAANDKLNLAVIGVGGRGAANLNGLANQNIVALCDVDDRRAGKAYTRFPNARKFFDYRKMFDAMEGQIDGVVVSTPDHTHFHPSMLAMEAGKHLYCEKPMAHDVWQVRAMTEKAKEKKIATQLGVQRHTIPNVHRVVELIKAGTIGNVSEVYSWVGGKRGMPGSPNKFPDVPNHLKWDLWLGPTKYRPYSPAYCPYNWRFWWDFGTGETGNWGCHILDIPYWALDLTYPTKVEASGPPAHDQMTPKAMQTRFRFPATPKRQSVVLHWSHSARGPAILREKGLSSRGANTVFVGTEGILVCGFGNRKLYPEEKFKNHQAPEKSIPDSPGFYKEWINACRGGAAATCDFDYSGPLTETVLLGNVAYRTGGFEWDARNLIPKGNKKSTKLIREESRRGWKLT